MIKVENFEGKANQFVMHTDNEIIFQSYNKIIAKQIIHQDGTFDVIIDTKAENYSTTTSKYLYKWLSMYVRNIGNKKDLQKFVDNGYILREDLNK